MSDIRDCGTSPQRRTSDWASWKSLRNVVVEQRRVPVEVPLSQRTGLPRSVATIGRPTVPNFPQDRKSTRLNSSHPSISYAVFCLKKKKKGNYRKTPASLTSDP